MNKTLSSDIAGYAAVLFDMDGVIMNSMDYHTMAWQQVFLSLGKDISREFILQNEGSSDVFLWMDKLFGKQLIPGSAAVEEAAEYMRGLGRRQRAIFLAEYQDKVRPYAGAPEMLLALRQRNIPMALVTSSSRLTMESIVPAPLQDCLQATVCAEDVRSHKPQPEPYLAAAARLKVDVRKCLVVENSPGGIAAALAAQASCAAIASTLECSFLQAANRVFADLPQLAAYMNL